MSEFVKDLRIQPVRSNQVIIGLIFLHLAACISLILSSLQTVFSVVLLSLILVCLLCHLKKQAFSWKRSGKSLQFNKQGQWLFQQSGEHIQSFRLLSPTLVLPWLVILRLRADGRSRFSIPLSIILTRDNMPVTDFRRLRVRLLNQASEIDS